MPVAAPCNLVSLVASTTSSMEPACLPSRRDSYNGTTERYELCDEIRRLSKRLPRRNSADAAQRRFDGLPSCFAVEGASSAVVTFLALADTEPTYVDAAAVLGHSARRYLPGSRRIAMVAGGAIPQGAARRLKPTWELCSVPTLLPALRKPLSSQYFDTFSKLHYTGLTQFQTLLYFDADVLLVAPAAALLRALDNTPHAIAATADVGYGGVRSSVFNSGVLVIRPSRELHAAVLSALTRSNAPMVGEQDFLNAFFGGFNRCGRLSPRYNANLYLIIYAREVWEREVLASPGPVVVHYTLNKPFKVRLNRTCVRVPPLPPQEYGACAQAACEEALRQHKRIRHVLKFRLPTCAPVAWWRKAEQQLELGEY